MKIYQDILQEVEEERPSKTRFKILTSDTLPFEYEPLPDGTFITDANANYVEGLGLIEILERDIPQYRNLFSGPPEPIKSDGLKFVQPAKGIRNLEGEDLNIEEFGGWKCKRCEHVTHIPINGNIKSPFECDNDACGRKGPFEPQFPKELAKPIWKLPLQPIPANSTEVYTDIYNFSKKYLILKPDEYHILTLWIMGSWLVDDFQTCPYLCMIAPKSSGKTQVLNVLGELAYRAVSAVSVTPASLFRSIELWHITLLIDEAEYQIKADSESGQALYGCLNGGYKRGSYAIRIEGDDRIPTTYGLFGFKAIASTKLFLSTLESRSIVFNMAQGMPEKILVDAKEAEIIRAKLLFWRFSTLGKLPLIQPESRSGRLIEMFIPLYTVAQVLKKTSGIKMPISYEGLIDLLGGKMREMESQRKEEERGSVEAQIIQAIITLRDRTVEDNGDRYERFHIPVKDISEELRWDGLDRKAWNSPGKVGMSLKTMGVETKRLNSGVVVQHLEARIKSRLDELEKRFLTTEDIK